MSITENTTALISASEPTLLRIFYNNFFCGYGPALGILSSNFTVCKPVKNIDKLKARAELTEASPRNHCGGDSTNSITSSVSPDISRGSGKIVILTPDHLPWLLWSIREAWTTW